MSHGEDHLDGCALDFAVHPTSDDEIEQLLVPSGDQAVRALASVAGLDTSLTDRLRRDGLEVREIAGWQTRGRPGTFAPKGAVTHHTAGAPRSAGVAPSLGIIINGRSDLNGPLANTYIDYDGNVYVVAAGIANHAGLTTGPKATSWADGNSDAWGLEVEHPGTFALDEKRADLMARVQAATIRGTAGADRVLYHWEWALGRGDGKIDLATAPSPAVHRTAVARFLAAANPEEDEMKAWMLPTLKWYMRDRRPETRPKIAPRGMLGDEFFALVAAVAEIHRGLGPPSLFDTWADWKILDGNLDTRPDQIPDQIPHLPRDRWWPGINSRIAFAKAYADRADDPLQAELAAKIAEAADLQTKVAALEDRLANGVATTKELQRLRATLAATRRLLENALAQLDATEQP